MEYTAKQFILSRGRHIENRCSVTKTRNSDSDIYPDKLQIEVRNALYGVFVIKDLGNSNLFRITDFVLYA